MCTTDELLFVARSKTAKLSLDAAGKGTLELAAVPTMTWFSDRPKHDAGTSATTDSLQAFGWKKNGDSLGDAAPNAALTADNLREAAVVKLLSASRDGDELTFQVATVSEAQEKDAAPRELSLSTAELFIDSVGECGGPSESETVSVPITPREGGARSQPHNWVVAHLDESGTKVLVTFYRGAPVYQEPDMMGGDNDQAIYPSGPDVPGKQFTFTLTEDQPRLTASFLLDLQFSDWEVETSSDTWGEYVTVSGDAGWNEGFDLITLYPWCTPL